MTRRDLSYILRERKRRANPSCPDCGGDGTTYSDSVNLRGGETDYPCACLFRDGDFEPTDDESWSGGFAPNH